MVVANTFTKIRHFFHSLKQDWYYKTGRRQRGYSPDFVRMIGESMKLPNQRARVASAACKRLFFPDITVAVAPECVLTGKILRKGGAVIDLGILSTKVLTDAFVNYLVSEMQSSTGGIANFRYHGTGIGVAAEAVSDTALGSEVGTRATGTQTTGSSSNIYKTVGSVSYTGSYAITEHGLFRASTAGELADRSTFGAINVASGDAIEFTYQLTWPSGS